jgi:DNA-binding MarR family transcriptional regulator
LDNSQNRDAGIFAAVHDGQHSMTDIAAEIGLTVSRVSRIVKSVGVEAKGKVCCY